MPALVIRPLTAADADAAGDVAFTALQVPPEFDTGDRRAWLRLRVSDIGTRYPDGAWVAEEDGRITGVALAVLTEGIWGLSLLAVDPGTQSRGTGRRLVEATLGLGPAKGWIITSTVDPRAMRLYATSGFALRPCVAAAGIVQRDRIPAGLGAREALEIEHAATLSRAVRGGAYNPEDLGFLAGNGHAPLSLGERGFALHREGSPTVICARDDEAAAELLWACLAAAPPGGTVHVDFMAADQDWAVRTTLAAGLALSPDGPIFTRGELGPLRPWLPSGAFL